MSDETAVYEDETPETYVLEPAEASPAEVAASVPFGRVLSPRPQRPAGGSDDYGDPFEVREGVVPDDRPPGARRLGR